MESFRLVSLPPAANTPSTSLCSARPQHTRTLLAAASPPPPPLPRLDPHSRLSNLLPVTQSEGERKFHIVFVFLAGVGRPRYRGDEKHIGPGGPEQELRGGVGTAHFHEERCSRGPFLQSRPPDRPLCVRPGCFYRTQWVRLRGRAQSGPESSLRRGPESQ